MTTYWRNAGLNYLQYSAVCARLLRRALKPDHRANALLREESLLKVTRWKDGKPEKAESLIRKTQ